MTVALVAAVADTVAVAQPMALVVAVSVTMAVAVVVAMTPVVAMTMAVVVVMVGVRSYQSCAPNTRGRPSPPLALLNSAGQVFGRRQNTNRNKSK